MPRVSNVGFVWPESCRRSPGDWVRFPRRVSAWVPPDGVPGFVSSWRDGGRLGSFGWTGVVVVGFVRQDRAIGFVRQDRALGFVRQDRALGFVRQDRALGFVQSGQWIGWLGSFRRIEAGPLGSFGRGDLPHLQWALTWGSFRLSSYCTGDR